MHFPLSKYEKSLLKEIESKFDKALKEGKNPKMHHCSVRMANEEYLELKDWLDLMVEKCYLAIMSYDNEKLCIQYESFDGFNRWVEDQNKKSKQLRRRDWIIAIVSALIGAIIGVVIK